MPRSKKTSNDTLTYTKKTVYELNGKKAFDTALAYAEEYKKFLDTSKTEREAVATAIKMAEANGYKAYSLGKTVKPGDRYYFNNRDKNLFLFQIGSEPLENGIRITASHIDSPRLDLKPCPLYEESGMSFFKTHYYGGIRKYQWVTVPLALHGIVARTDGTVVNINIGDEDGDPVFYVDDLLPHLGRATNAKPLGEAIPAEKLNVVTGSFPGEKADEKDAVKAYTLSLIHEKYGICEEDFFSADLCLVPAGKARDVGFDRSRIVGYGHDDKCCAYPYQTALFA
ncbi:MAG: aminopeptidase, partial [Clostridia bacterium]|nr:aminopeptidase [Clostridia bacterium]